jgi:hypothetical protein
MTNAIECDYWLKLDASQLPNVMSQVYGHLLDMHDSAVPQCTMIDSIRSPVLCRNVPTVLSPIIVRDDRFHIPSSSKGSANNFLVLVALRASCPQLMIVKFSPRYASSRTPNITAPCLSALCRMKSSGSWHQEVHFRFY